MTTDGNQYSFMQGSIKELSVKASLPASLFAVEVHVECVRMNWANWPRLSRSACTIIIQSY